LATDKDGPYHQEVRYRLAELAFADARFARAARGYRAALDGTLSDEMRGLAGYKLAWAYYLDQNDPAAIVAAKAYIDSKRTTQNGNLRLDASAMAEPKWERVREVMTVLGRLFYRQNGVASLEAAFPSGRDYLHMVYRRLADVSAQLGDPTDAVPVYESFLSRYPTAVQAPVFLGYMVDRYTEAGKEDQAVATRERLVNDFGLDSPWWQAQTAATRHKAMPVLKQTTHRLARYHHARAQQSKKRQDYELAGRWYRRYLATYPDAREAGQISFLLGEGLFESGAYAEAAKAYDNGAYQYATHTKAAESAYAAVYTRERHLAQLGADDPKYAPLLADLVASFSRMVEHYPREPRLPAAYGRVSALLFEAKDYDRLYTLTDHVIRYGPRSRALHIQAWRTLGEAALETGRTGRAEEALEQALKYVQDDPKKTAQIGRLLAAAVVSRVSDPAVGAEVAAAALNRAATLLDKDDPLAQSVRVDGITRLLREGHYPEGMDRLAGFMDEYPQNNHLERLAGALMGAGERALADGDPEVSATLWGLYETLFAGQFPKRDRKLARLAGRTHLESGDLDAADLAFTRLLATYVNEGEAVPEVDRDRLAGIRFKRAAARIQAGDASGLDLLDSVVNEFSESLVVPTALDALVTGASSFAAHDRALAAAERLVERYSGSPQADAAERRMVSLLVAVGRPGDAAAWLMREADWLGADAEDSATAKLVAASDLYEQAGSPELAIGVMTALRDRFDVGADRWVAASVDVIHLEEVGSRKLPVQLAPEVSQTIDERLLALLTPLEAADSLGAAGRAIGSGIWRGRAEVARAAMDDIQLVPPLKKNLKAKKRALKVALGLLAKVQGFRSRDDALNATYQMGEMMASFGNRVLASPVPDSLNEQAAGIYQKGLVKNAAPYLKRAIKIHQKNLRRLRDGVSTADTRSSLEALARLKPEWYDRPPKGIRIEP